MKKRLLNTHILDLLKKEHLLSAPAIIEILRESGYSYNKTSVYRALERLLLSEQICRTSLGKSEIYYELRHDDHAHLICNQCGLIQVADLSLNGDLSGFKIEHQHITVFGHCSKCLKKKGDP